MEFFHASGLLFESGDVIQPGSWGRVILGAGAGHSFFFRELLFEEVRQRVDPTKPSRLRAFFGLQTLDDLQRYRGEVGLPHGYRVEVPDTAHRHIGDLQVFDRLRMPAGRDSALALVEHYWQGTGTFSEVLVETPVTVLEHL